MTKTLDQETVNEKVSQNGVIRANRTKSKKQEDVRKYNIIKERLTIQISHDVIERVKNCVYWNRLTVTQFVEEALETALKEAEKQNGRPFLKRRSELKPGRPTK
jgi:hypothetical protein